MTDEDTQEAWYALKFWLMDFPANNPDRLLGSSEVLEKMDELEETFG
jgi:hypothetical protein